MRTAYSGAFIFLLIVVLSSCSPNNPTKQPANPTLTVGKAQNLVKQFYAEHNKSVNVTVKSNGEDAEEINGNSYYSFDVYYEKALSVFVKVNSANGKIYETEGGWFDESISENDSSIAKWVTPDRKNEKYPLYETLGKLYIKTDGSVIGILESQRDLDGRGTGARSASAVVRGKFDGKKGKCFFSEDGWGNSGEVYLKLEGNKLTAQIKLTKREYSNWSIIEEQRLLFLKKK